MFALLGFCGPRIPRAQFDKYSRDTSYVVSTGADYCVAFSTRYVKLKQLGDNSVSLKAAISGITSFPDIEIEIANGSVQLSRDAFGRMSLYRLDGNDGIWFCTHLRPLLEIVPSAPLSPRAFHTYQSFSFVSAPLSPIDNIRAVTAGTAAAWQLCAPTVNSEEQAITMLRNELHMAAGAQLSDLSSERVAVFLSGGLDSALTAALLKRAGADVTAYSLDFGPYGLSELPYAQEVGHHLRIPVKPVRALPKDIRRAFLPTVNALDTVYGDGVTIPLWLLNEAASRDGFRVAFNGEGGDQLFGGWTNKPLIASSVYGEQESLCNTYLRTFHRLHGFEQVALQPGIRQRLETSETRKYIEHALDQSTDDQSLIHILRRANLMLKGAQNIQPRASNIAIDHQLQLRSFFCDRRLADWTFTVTPELMLRGSCEKYILKRAIEGWLPESIVYREKRGMGVPLTEWCLGPMWGHIGRYLNSKRLAATGYWHPDLPNKLVMGELGGLLIGRRIGEILWLMLMWEAWLDCNSNSIGRHTRYNSFWPPVPLLKLLRKERAHV